MHGRQFVFWRLLLQQLTVLGKIPPEPFAGPDEHLVPSWFQQKRLTRALLLVTKVLNFLQLKFQFMDFQVIQGYMMAISCRHAHVGHK